MYKLPYTISDFKKIREQGYYYVDRTGYIRKLEDYGEVIILVRPRRFGKTLLVSMLETYYDINEANNFERYFRG